MPLQITTFRFLDLVDILATSVLIYYLLLLIRGTRAVQIIYGLITLIVIMGVADFLQLLVLKTIVQFMVIGTAFTLPIIFQPELRRALERIGRGGVFAIPQANVEVTSVSDVVTTLAQAAMLLSKNRVGALIAIEQSSGLKEYTESGTTLEARLSVELLLTLFTPKSPLHDGAVVLRGATIAAAGCFLPLADAVLMERRMGTRHRAAIGLTEQTDAVALIISEETGDISVARGGRLSRKLDDEERLRKVLLACLRSPRPPRERHGRLVRVRAVLGALQKIGKRRVDAHPKELHT